MDTLFTETPIINGTVEEDEDFPFGVTFTEDAKTDADEDIASLLDQVAKSELKTEPEPEPDASCNALGSFIKAMRIKRGLRLSDLAEISGISNCVLSQTENGKLPSGKVTEKLIDAFVSNDKEKETENLTSNIKVTSQILSMMCRSEKFLSVIIDLLDEDKETLNYSATVLKALLDAKRI